MKKHVLIINGHPNPEAFNVAIAKAYKEGAQEVGTEIQELTIADLVFNPNLQFGYHEIMPLEPDLEAAREKILWADHLVWVHPVWWGGLPAITKGFIDRLFLPGFAFRFKKDSIWWDKLLKGRTAHIITTIDQPSWYYRLFTGQPSVNQLKKSTLEFCGISPVKVTYLGPVKSASEETRIKWLDKIHSLGEKLK